MAKDKPAVFDVEAELKDAQLHINKFEKEIADGLTDFEIETLKIERAEAKRFAKHRGDVQQVLKSVEARRFFWRLLELGGPYQPTFVPGHADVSAFNEGKRSMSIEILKIIMDADPSIYMQMQREAASDKKSEAERNRKETQGEIE